MRYIVLLFITLFYIFPSISWAQVIINEVAWMGGPDSANDEWIELYHSGSSTLDLTGWTLAAADGSPSIDLSGSLNPGDYYIVERTDDQSAPTVSANVIYTGALSNTGEVLSLQDVAGTQIDVADGASGWPAGDSASRQTMQRSSSSWITADATPGAVNATSSTGDTGDPVDQGGGSTGTTAPASTTSSASSSNKKPKRVKVDHEILLDAPSHGVVDLQVEFVPSVTGQFGQGLLYGFVTWNFGDGTQVTIDDVEPVKHRYQFPGTYVVTAQYQDRETRATPQASVSTQIVIEALDVTIRDVNVETGTVQLENGGNQNVDLGDWRLRSPLGEFVIPEATIVLAGGTLSLPASVTELDFRQIYQVSLLSPAGDTVDSRPQVRRVKDPPRQSPPPLAERKQAVDSMAVEPQTEPAALVDPEFNPYDYLPAQASESVAPKVVRLGDEPASDSQGTLPGWVWVVIGILALGLVVCGALVWLVWRRSQITSQSTEAYPITAVTDDEPPVVVAMGVAVD